MAMVRVRGGLSTALTSHEPMPTSRDCHSGRPIASYLKRLRFFWARTPCRSCLSYLRIQPIRPMKASKPTRPRNTSISIQPRESSLRRSFPCRSSRPSRPIHYRHPTMRVPSNTPRGLPMLCILSRHVRIATVTRLGATFRQVSSVILVSLLVLTITVILFRLRIPSALFSLYRLSARWPTIGYDMVDRIGRITIHPYF